MEVVPGIHKIDGTWGGNVYLLVDDDGLDLVDAALPFNTGKILRYINRLGRDPSELRYLILTHAHPDHTGTIPNLSSRANLQVLVHPQDTKVRPDGRRWLYFPGRHLVAAYWDLPFFRRIYAQEMVEEGHRLPIMGGLRVLHTPGHTPGSIVLHLEERGVLFTGDILLSDGKRFTRPIPFPGTNFKEYRRSVERLARMEFDVACVGHGRPLMGDATSKVHEMLENYFWASPWWTLMRRLSPFH